MSVMLAIPSYDGKLHYDTVRGISQTVHVCAAKQIGVKVDVRPHDAFIGKARSIMCEQFLASGLENLLFIDADIGFGIAEVAKICMVPGDIAMGLYRLKVTGPDEAKWIKYSALMADPVERHPDDPFLIRLKYGPAGFLRIRRPALEAMMNKWPDQWFCDDTMPKIHDFFPAGRRGNWFVGEDIEFCNRAQECGIPIWGVQGLALRHYGEKAWPSNWQIDVQVPADKEAA